MGGGGDQTKPSSHKPPPPSSSSAAASSSHHHRKSRWSSSSTTATNNNNKKPQKHNAPPSSKPIPTPPSQSQPNHPPPTTQFPPPPPPFQPTYGFHMLDRRTIILSDGSVRSYFALPPDYQDFTPPPPRPIDPFVPERFRDSREHWNGVLKRKQHPGDDERGRIDEKDEFYRQRQHLLQYQSRPEYLCGTSSGSSPFRREMGGDDVRGAKYMRVAGIGGGSDSGGGVPMPKPLGVDPVALKKAFLHFVKVVFENPVQKKSYLENKKGRLQCLVCGRSSKDFPDVHGLIMHAYTTENADSRVDHLGLHKALCVLMGWNFLKAPDNSKAYQILPAQGAAANQDDLIVWPPHVIVHNTSTGKGKEGRMEGYGNKVMDIKIRELGFMGGKSKSLYGREGHLGITLFRYPGDEAGLRDALRLAEYFEKNNRGRKSWARVQHLTTSKDDDKNPSLVEVDERTGEKKRVLYGYVATVSDLDKLDFETKKKTTVESLSEYRPSK